MKRGQCPWLDQQAGIANILKAGSALVENRCSRFFISLLIIISFHLSLIIALGGKHHLPHFMEQVTWSYPATKKSGSGTTGRGRGAALCSPDPYPVPHSTFPNIGPERPGPLAGWAYQEPVSHPSPDGPTVTRGNHSSTPCPEHAEGALPTHRCLDPVSDSTRHSPVRPAVCPRKTTWVFLKEGILI